MRRTLVSCAALLVTLLGSASALAEDLGAPFGELTLVDEVIASDPKDPHTLYEDPPGSSSVQTVLGKPARVLPMADDAQVFAYKIGAGNGLVAGKAYVLVVEYPEDAGRQLVVINRGGEMTRTFATGQTIGDAREGYTYPSPESLKYPLSGKWESIRSYFVLGQRFQGIKASRDSDKAVWEGTPETGFWVVIGHFRKKDSPLDAGAAVARIRLFAVPDSASMDAPIHFPPSDLPRRHLFFREEMADVSFGANDPSHRFFDDSIDVFDAKMRVAKFLGMNTWSRHLLVFGYTQFWDNAYGGGNEWYYNTQQPKLWGQMVDAAQKHGMDILPYYEYAGAMGAGSGGTPSLGYQHRCRPLGDRTNNQYSDVWWSESSCVDVTDPDFQPDVDKLLDATIGQYKDKAQFVGAWFRTRNTNWPISFTDATMARFDKENGTSGTTRDKLKSDSTLLSKYYQWWFGKRRDFLAHIRDHLRSSANPAAEVLFTSYVEEALHVPSYTDWTTPTDDVPTWDKINGTSPWQWRFAPSDWSNYVSKGSFLEMITRFGPPTAETLTNHQPEGDHSAPPPDVSHYADVDGVHMTMPFSRAFTVSSAAAFDAFRSKSGLAIVRHFNLNEEDGQNASAPDGPMSKRVGYFVSDVDRAGPYSMLAEARAMAFGDPRYVGYLSSSNFGRGFPEYTRAFDQAFLALPALPSKVVAGAASDAEVVVRSIDAGTHGTYYAIVNTGLQSKTGVNVTIATSGTIHDLVTDKDFGAGSLSLSLYPGELRSYVVGGDPAAVDAGGPGDPGNPGSPGGDAGVQPGNGDAPVEGSTGCGCTTAGAAGGSWAGIGAIVAAFLARRRRKG